MNYDGLMDILLFIRTRRKCKELVFNPEQNGLISTVLGPNHIEFDMKIAEQVIELIDRDIKKKGINLAKKCPE